MKSLKKIDLFEFTLETGKNYRYLPLFYQTFGQPLGNAPIVVVNHALTGNSNVAGDTGWWNDLIGQNKTIDTEKFTVIAFNIPGNGYDGNPAHTLENYRDFSVRDVARIFWEGLFFLQVESVFAIIGGSLGGAVAWEMTVLQPNKVQNLIPIASDWKATDWVIANVLIQDQILNSSKDPIANARLHAMLLYRTPESINQRFQRSRTEVQAVFQIENWLLNHGVKLKNRFRLSSYKLMNHLLKTNDITRGRGSLLTVVEPINASIHLVAVNTDYFFIPEENYQTYVELKKLKESVFYHEIQSVHGHDAFLIEFEQLAQLLAPIFNTQKQLEYVNN